MDDPIRGFTIQEYARLTAGAIYEIRAALMLSVGYGELAKTELDPSHPAFSHIAKALQGAERARAVVAEFDRVFHRLRKEAEANKGVSRDKTR
jgi:hypothetical protein